MTMNEINEKLADLEKQKSERSSRDAYLLDDPDGTAQRRSNEDWKQIYSEEAALLREKVEMLSPPTREGLKRQALAKLTPEERKALGV